jgi:rhodanese-related sulfurtransferase
MARNEGVRELLWLMVLGGVLGAGAWFATEPDFASALGTNARSATVDEHLERLKGAGSAEAAGEDAGSIPLVTNVDFNTVMTVYFGAENVHFIDARDAGTFEAGHVPGAIHIDAERLDVDEAHGQAMLNAVPRQHAVVVYCSGGNCDLSMRLGRNLIARGFRNVLVFEGGWSEWVAEGAPSEEGAAREGE